MRTGIRVHTFYESTYEWGYLREGLTFNEAHKHTKYLLDAIQAINYKRL